MVLDSWPRLEPRDRAMVQLRRILVAACLVLAACTTPERRAALDACTLEWHSRMPAEHESRTVTRHRLEEVPDGTETCITETVRDRSDPLRSRYTTRRTCTPNMKEIRIPYQVRQEVDIHAEDRNVRIRDCAARRCLASHGSVSCKGGG